jgi:serine protease Do
MEIAEDSKIAETELKAGDFITEIDGVAIENHTQLYNMLKQYEIGEKIPATCVHFDEEHNPIEYEIEFEVMEDTSGDY